MEPLDISAEISLANGAVRNSRENDSEMAKLKANA